MNVKTILLPVDGSVHSDKAAEYAADMAKTMNAAIVLLHCRKAVPADLGEPNVQQVLERYTKEAETILKPYRDLLESRNIPIRETIIGGRPGEAIADVAEAEKADMVVMGSKGKSDLEGLIVGSVTHKVLHTAHCPVLVVK